MPIKLSRTVNRIDSLQNEENRLLIKRYHDFLKSIESSERHQNNNLKTILYFAIYIAPTINLNEISDEELILSFLDSKKKTKEEDPDEKWKSTWNHYFHRIKHFFRWYHNCESKNHYNESKFKYFTYLKENQDNWETPEFLENLQEKKTKRLSPYVESELFTKEELLSIIKYEQYTRNKAILSLMWDLNARPHEITLLKIKHIRMKEKYAEGEIPHEAKTSSGPIMLTFSFSICKRLVK